MDDFVVVAGWARDPFTSGSDDSPAWKKAPVGLLLVIQSGLVVVATAAAVEEPMQLSSSGVFFLLFCTPNFLPFLWHRNSLLATPSPI